MKITRPLIILFIALLALLLVTGCSSLPAYQAEEVHQTMALPGYTSEIHATGIKKETQDDGTVVRKADSLTHTTSILGFSRTAVYKGAEIKSKE